MRVEISLRQLSEALAIVSRAVASRPQLPVLLNVLIEAEATGVRLSTTDLELGISLFVAGKVEQEGRVTVPCKMLFDYVNSIVGEKVTLEVEEGKLRVLAGSYVATMATIEASEFPQMTIPEKTEIEFEQTKLSAALERVLFAAAKDSLRPILTGVLFEVEKKKMRVVATDGFRLALADLAIAGVEEGQSFVISARAAMEIARASKEGVGRMVYLPDTKQVVVKFMQTTILAQTMEGNFPDYKRILPKGFEVSFVVGREELLQTVKSVSVFARDNANVMKWRVVDGELSCVGEAQEKGLGKASCEVEMIEGEEISIAFNAKYVLDFLSSSAAENIRVRLGANLSPGTFQEDGNEDYLYVVMPINV